MLTEPSHLTEFSILFRSHGFRLVSGFTRKRGCFWVSAWPVPRQSVTTLLLCICALVCRERDARIADLKQQLAVLQAQNRKLGERARRNASNSSIAPSTNPPDAPKPVNKKPTGRKPGG